MSGATPKAEPTTLVVAPVSNLAGVARHIIDLARVGVPGWRMVVAAPDGPLLDVLRDHDCAVIPLEIDSLALPKAVAALRKVIQRLRPAVVHTHLAKADILVALATVGVPVKLISTEHHIPPDRFMFHKTLLAATAMETVHHLRLRRFDAAMAVSASTKRDMLRWWKTRTPITVVLNGVDRPSERMVRGPGRRFLSLTRLSPEKNVEATVRAFASLAQRYDDATLTVAGSGPEGPALEALARSLQVADRVLFPGFVDPEEAMNSHDVIVQPSKSDNCSYTLLDAVAQGMGVAASPIGGNPEILPSHCIASIEDETGLARIMLDQADNPSLRPQLPDAVPTVAQMAASVAEVYAQAVKA